MIALVLTALPGRHAQAQVGRSESEFAALYGEPVNAVEGAQGDVVLHYRSAEGEVEAGLQDGRINRVLFRKSPLTEADILAFLAHNADGFEWRPLEPMLMPELHTREWIRSDDTLLASLRGDTVLVGTSQWHRDTVRGPTETNSASDMAAESLPPATRIPVGVWTGRNAKGEPVGMTIEPEGAATWVVITRAGPREFTLVVTEPEDAMGPLSVCGDTADAVALGQLRRDVDMLTFTPATAVGGRLPSLLWQMRVTEGVVLNRDTALPQWEVPLLPAMPAPGTTRDEVLALLGKPRGLMGRGRQEVLMYPGGRVILEGGRVTKVETQ